MLFWRKKCRELLLEVRSWYGCLPTNRIIIIPQRGEYRFLSTCLFIRIYCRIVSYKNSIRFTYQSETIIKLFTRLTVFTFQVKKNILMKHLLYIKAKRYTFCTADILFRTPASTLRCKSEPNVSRSIQLSSSETLLGTCVVL